VVVEVHDTGAEVAPELLPRAFEPFCPVRSGGAGAGLGLSVCHGAVASAGGTVEVESAPGRGTTFRVALPVAQPAIRAAAEAPATRRGTVLVVDDDPLVGRSIARLLQGPHDVTYLASPLEALGRIERGERWDAIVCDLMMPELSGMDLDARLARIAPDLLRRVLYLTGGAFTEQARQFLAEGRPWLEKPADAAVLRARVDELVRASPAA
jgi:two-component system NtrC family sensor kinase